MYIDQEIFDSMVDEQQECQAFVDRSSDLIDIWTSCVLTESALVLRNAEAALETAEATYYKLVNVKTQT